MMKSSKLTCMAVFVPQAWQGDYAIDVDPGETEFDVADQIEAMGHAKALELRDNSDASDNLAQGKNAPDWIKQWNGPYYVRIEDGLADYLDAKKSLKAENPHRQPAIDDFSI